jgi:ParB family chromosome partitioning protein
MELIQVAYRNLSISPPNMRFGTTPDVTGILPTVRKRGILQPLLVRPNGSPETFEVIAGARRPTAAGTIVDEAGDIDPLPCAVLAEADDAAAVEASLIETLPGSTPTRCASTRLSRAWRSRAARSAISPKPFAPRSGSSVSASRSVI